MYSTEEDPIKYMYLPASKYKVFYSREEIKTLEGTPYLGPFIKTYDGRYFQGDKIDSLGPSLIGPPAPTPPRPTPPPVVQGPGGPFIPEGRKKQLSPAIVLPRTVTPSVSGPGGLYIPDGRTPPADRGKSIPELFHTLYLPPSEADYLVTEFTRYIVQNPSNRRIIETTSFRFDRLVSTGEYIGVTVNWKILGPLLDVTYNGALIRGTTQQNVEVLSEAENTIPEVKQFLTDPGQYNRTPARVTAIEQATGNRVILRTSDFVLLKFNINIPPPPALTYVLPGYVVIGYVP